MPWTINDAIDVVKWIIESHGGNDDAQAWRQICTYIAEAEKSTHNKARQCASQICPNAIQVPVVVEDRPGEKVAFVVCRTSGKLLPC